MYLTKRPSQVCFTLRVLNVPRMVAEGCEMAVVFSSPDEKCLQVPQVAQGTAA